jgi:chromosome segregation ATPase
MTGGAAMANGNGDNNKASGWVSRNWVTLAGVAVVFGGMQVGLAHVQSDQVSASSERDDIKDLVQETRETLEGLRTAVNSNTAAITRLDVALSELQRYLRNSHHQP